MLPVATVATRASTVLVALAIIELFVEVVINSTFNLRSTFEHDCTSTITAAIRKHLFEGKIVSIRFLFILKWRHQPEKLLAHKISSLL